MDGGGRVPSIYYSFEGAANSSFGRNPATVIAEWLVAANGIDDQETWRFVVSHPLVWWCQVSIQHRCTNLCKILIHMGCGVIMETSHAWNPMPRSKSSSSIVILPDASWFSRTSVDHDWYPLSTINSPHNSLFMAGLLGLIIHRKEVKQQRTCPAVGTQLLAICKRLFPNITDRHQPWLAITEHQPHIDHCWPWLVIHYHNEVSIIDYHQWTAEHGNGQLHVTRIEQHFKHF